MVDTIDIGREGEQLALDFLKAQGLAFRDANYRCKQGEIDLIMENAKTIVFVEVRKRKNDSHGSGYETVQATKQHKLFQAATSYLLKHNLYESAYCRFDIISINDLDQITWIQNAFERDYDHFI